MNVRQGASVAIGADRCCGRAAQERPCEGDGECMCARARSARGLRHPQAIVVTQTLVELTARYCRRGLEADGAAPCCGLAHVQGWRTVAPEVAATPVSAPRYCPKDQFVARPATRPVAAD